MSSTAAGEIRVLHVDDDPSFGDLTATFLERESAQFAVETVTSADKGIGVIADDPPDCVVSDYNMPGRNGLEFLKAVREAYPDLPFILFTGKGSEQVASDAVAADVTDYLQKGSGTGQYELLANRIRNAVQARRDAQRAGRQQELMRLTEFAGDTGGWEVDLEEETTRLTDGTRRLIGLPEDRELSLEEAIAMYHPEDRPDIQQALDRAVETGEQIEDSCRLETVDGDERTLNVTITPVEEGGEVTKLRGAIHDITKQERREQELKTERRFIRQALDTLDDLFYVINTDGTLRRWNETSLDVTGYSELELDGMPALELFPADEHEKVGKAISEILAGEITTVEADILSRDGRRVPHEFRGAPLTNETGDTTGLVGIGRDLTERRQQQRQLEMFFEESPLGAVQWDETFQFERLNECAEEILGYSEAELRGESWELIVDERDHTQMRSAVESLLDADGGTRVRSRNTRKNGETITCEWHNRVVTDADGSVQTIFSKFEDVTEQVEKERELRAQTERLEEFVGIVSHDLRSPLTVAEGHLELAQETCESDSLSQAADAIERGQTLIDDLLTLARQNEAVTEVEQVDLGAVAGECWQTVGTEAETATLEVDTTRIVRADVGQLKQLLKNLYRNAVEHGGKDVTVTVGELPGGFHVTDTGPGIPEDDRAQVFEAVDSTSEGGTGFGLRIVRQIADAHGWAVAVTEGKQGGARFEVTNVEFGDR